jgi:hypothetical protein
MSSCLDELTLLRGGAPVFASAAFDLRKQERSRIVVIRERTAGRVARGRLFPGRVLSDFVTGRCATHTACEGAAQRITDSSTDQSAARRTADSANHRRGFGIRMCHGAAGDRADAGTGCATGCDTTGGNADYRCKYQADCKRIKF